VHIEAIQARAATTFAQPLEGGRTRVAPLYPSSRNCIADGTAGLQRHAVRNAATDSHGWASAAVDETRCIHRLPGGAFIDATSFLHVGLRCDSAAVSSVLRQRVARDGTTVVRLCDTGGAHALAQSDAHLRVVAALCARRATLVSCSRDAGSP